MNMTTNKTVLVFGTFDKLHEGHRAFLKQAKALGSHLIVNLAQDGIVEQLKGKNPSQSLSERQKSLEELEEVNQVIGGDMELGTYTSVASIQPDVIALGYDQDALKGDLESWLDSQNINAEIVTLKPYKPETYKTSLLS